MSGSGEENHDKKMEEGPKGALKSENTDGSQEVFVTDEQVEAAVKEILGKNFKKGAGLHRLVMGMLSNIVDSSVPTAQVIQKALNTRMTLTMKKGIVAAFIKVRGDIENILSKVDDLKHAGEQNAEFQDGVGKFMIESSKAQAGFEKRLEETEAALAESQKDNEALQKEIGQLKQMMTEGNKAMLEKLKEMQAKHEEEINSLRHLGEASQALLETVKKRIENGDLNFLVEIGDNASLNSDSTEIRVGKEANLNVDARQQGGLARLFGGGSDKKK